LESDRDHTVSSMKPLARALVSRAHHPPAQSASHVVEPLGAAHTLYTPREKESLTLSSVRKYLLARRTSLCAAWCLYMCLVVSSRDLVIRSIAQTGHSRSKISSIISLLRRSSVASN
jgi:hypothetical protein